MVMITEPSHRKSRDTKFCGGRLLLSTVSARLGLLQETLHIEKTGVAAPCPKGRRELFEPVFLFFHIAWGMTVLQGAGHVVVKRFDFKFFNDLINIKVFKFAA